MIKPAALIRLFQKALEEHWGYIYGKCEKWTDAKQKAYAKEFAGDPDRRASCLYGGRWAGHMVTDCARLFNWAFAKLGGSIARGSNTIWDKYCSAKGDLKAGRRTDGRPLLPGTAVFSTSGGRHNHIGLYIGDGKVIEAQGAEAGVVVSKVTLRKWTAWGELRGVDYHDQAKNHNGNQHNKEDKVMANVVLPDGASGSSVNLRQRPSRSAPLIGRVPAGSSVDILEDLGEWCRIEYGSLEGYMMSNYLEYEGQEGESGGESLTAEECRRLLAALTEIERQLEILRDTLGRG